jgi:PAS domain S-box-containing protein
VTRWSAAGGFLVLDVLGEVLGRADNPGRVGEYLTQQMRELTGARSVLLVQYPAEGSPAGPRLISVCPARRAASFDAAVCAEFSASTELADDRRADLLARLGADSGFALPLNVGAVRVGALVFLGLPEHGRRVRDVLDLLEPLNTVVGLVLRNALLFEQQEAVIADRTKEIRESEERFRVVVEGADDAVFLYRDGGRIWKVNPAACRMLGYDSATLERMTVADISAHYDAAGVAELERSLDRLGRIELTDEHRTANGNLVPVELRLTRLDVGGRTMTLALARDITERRRAEAARASLEAQLHQSQKLEAIGTLAGGIAHDFNNVLTPILAHAEMALLESPAGSPIRSDIEAILAGAQRARDMVQQILAFGRREEIERQTVDVRLVTSEALRLVRASLPSTITIDERLPAGAAVVVAVPTQIFQVVVNLCTNAAHAMKEAGGVLCVSLGLVTLDGGPLPGGVGAKPAAGRYIRLAVTDTGCGMDAPTLARVFEPYFTTKGRNEGSGLGLAVVHGIVTRHGGHLAATSLPTLGSTFEIYLPAADAAGASAVQPAPTAAVAGGHERILFVDDEPAIVRVAARILRQIGYEVTTLTESVEALRLLRETPDAFDLLISDQTLPGLTGVELVREAHAVRADLPVILCTGFSESLDERAAKAVGAHALLMKPFSREALTRAVRGALDAS